MPPFSHRARCSRKYVEIPGMGRVGDFYQQLKNRRVIRAAIIYLAAFWLVLQVADILQESDFTSDKSVRWLILGGTVGFPVALIMSWFLEHPWHQRKLLPLVGDLTLIAAVTAATALLAWQQWQRVYVRPVIAVLPFEPTDLQQGTEAMSRHLAGRIRMILAASPEIRVVETESSWSAVLSGQPLERKARSLGADFLVSGTVNQTKLNLRVNVQLFDRNGGLRWTGSFRDRIMDQYHLQNAVLEGLWEALKRDEAGLVQLREILQSCEYPANGDLITSYAEVELLLQGESGVSRVYLEQAISRLDGLIEDLNEAGLLHLLRARARLRLIAQVEPVHRPVMQSLAQKDLEEAAYLCPALPELDSLSLLASKRLESVDIDPRDVLERHPNDAELLRVMADLSQARGEAKQAEEYRKLVCVLDPLTESSSCRQNQPF